MSCGADLCALPGRMTGGQGCGCGGIVFGSGRGFKGGVCPLALTGYPGMKGGKRTKKRDERSAKRKVREGDAPPCGCGNILFGTIKGGYRATRRNKELLRKYKSGKSIGFSAVASLKAKGMLRRTSKTLKNKFVVGPKYKRTIRRQVR